ncbi:MAG TPA: pitrilysin family protein [Longimicrobiaceae bacterium]|nr:pitrilysin family protein [Longimicrobiaceae bacterium]
MSRLSIPSIEVPFRARTLGNGMRVVAHEDRSAPIVAVHLMYHAGSRHEVPGRTGLAHLLEHLMFEGTEHVPKGAFDDLLERSGGTNNGSTWLDRTNYYETVPSHAAELPLWLERDRMAHFLSVLDQEKLELQRGVVINERKQHYENRPYGLADERLSQLLFPEGHPYSWPTIGYIPDLEAMTLDDMRSFYGTYYTPSNSVLVLAGDLGADEAFALAERYFADLPPGPDAPRRDAPELRAPPPRFRRETLEDRVTFPRLYRAFAVPGYGTAEWVALDVLAYLLSDGESSRLQRALVRDGRIAQDVDAYLYPTELLGVFGVVSTARTGVPAEALEEAVARVIAEVAEGGVTEEEVAAAVRRVRRDQVAEMATVEGRADSLAYAATVLGAPERLEEVMEAYAGVTPEEVSRAAAEHLRPDAGATVMVVPAPGEVRDAA